MKKKKMKKRVPRKPRQKPKVRKPQPKAERFVYTSTKQMARDAGMSETQAHKSLEEMKSPWTH